MRARSESPGLWANGNWRLLWLGQSVSATGDMVFTMTVLLWIATVIARGQPWAPAAASGALIATAGPVLIVGPLAGVFVDRWNRRRTMLTADAARFALIASLLVLPLLQHRLPIGAQLGILYAVLAVCSCFAEFFNPSRLAILGAVVPPKHQPKASAQLSAAFNLAQVIGPPIAAPLLITFGVQWALILNSASFAISFACVRAIRVPVPAAQDAPARQSFRAEFKEGIRFFAASKVLVTLAIGIVIALLGNGALNSLSVFFIPHNLHVPASWLGTLAAAVGIGAISGALLAGAVTRRLRPGQLFWIALIGSGLALIGLSRTTALAPAIVAAALTGVAVGAVNAVISPLILSATPPHMIGRISAVLSPLGQVAEITSMILAGVLASTVLRGMHAVVAGVTFGPYDTVFAVAGLLFVIAGVASIGPMRGAARSSDAGESAAQAAQPADPEGPAVPASP